MTQSGEESKEMWILRPHIPAFVDVDRPSDITGETLDAILADSWVASFRRNYGEPSFDGFYYSPCGDGAMLLAVYGGNVKWWVVGYLNRMPTTLPMWHAPGEQKAEGQA